MSIDIYPAYIQGSEVHHADGWNPKSTLNLANNNFHNLMDHLGLSHLVMSTPGHIRVKTLRVALQTSEFTPYSTTLNKICAIAEIKKAPFIAFA